MEEANQVRQRLRTRALNVMRQSDLSGILELMGAGEDNAAAGAALKTIVAQRICDCAMTAMKEARKRRARVGAAAIIIAAQKCATLPVY